VRFQFKWKTEEGDPNPADFFRHQSRVTIRATDGTTDDLEAPSGDLPPRPTPTEGPPGITAGTQPPATTIGPSTTAGPEKQPAPAAQELGAGGPVVTVTDQLQIEELKGKGLLPATEADAIEHKLESNETLTFDEAKQLLDALNQVIESGSGKEASDAKDSWVKWARFLAANREKISGKAKAGGGKSIQDLQDILAKQQQYVAITGGAPVPSAEPELLSPEARKSWNALPQWQKDLLTEYTKKYGASPNKDIKDLTLGRSELMRMALQISPQYMPAGAHDAIVQMFNDPVFWISTFVGITLYIASIVAPEPIISKATAAGITVALLTVFALSEIKNLAVAWMDLSDESAAATNMHQLEEAAERFGRAVGGTLGRVLVTLAMIVAGKAVEGSLPPVGPGGPTPLAVTEGGFRVPVPAAAPVAVPAPVPVLAAGTVAAGPTATAVHMAIQGGGGGGGGKPAPEGPQAKTEAPIDYKSLPPEKLEALARAQDPDAALELASRQRAQPPFKSGYTTEDILENQAQEMAKGGHQPGLSDQEVLDQWGINERTTPGGKPVPKEFDLGNFAHKHAEALISEDQLPRGLDPEVKIKLDDGSELRMDRVSKTDGIVIEIKPDTPAQKAVGELQVKKYVQYMNQQYPLGPGRSWQGRVVTYDRAALLKALTKWGYLE